MWKYLRSLRAVSTSCSGGGDIGKACEGSLEEIGPCFSGPSFRASFKDPIEIAWTIINKFAFSLKVVWESFLGAGNLSAPPAGYLFLIDLAI